LTASIQEMSRELPREWQGIPYFTELPITIQDISRKTLAVGKGELKGSNFGAFRSEGEKPLDMDTAAFILLGDSAPVPVCRVYWLGSDNVSWFFESA